VSRYRHDGSDEERHPTEPTPLGLVGHMGSTREDFRCTFSLLGYRSIVNCCCYWNCSYLTSDACPVTRRSASCGHFLPPSAHDSCLCLSDSIFVWAIMTRRLLCCVFITKGCTGSLAAAAGRRFDSGIGRRPHFGVCAGSTNHWQRNLNIPTELLFLTVSSFGGKLFWKLN
jgi:hypothetical protein